MVIANARGCHRVRLVVSSEVIRSISGRFIVNFQLIRGGNSVEFHFSIIILFPAFLDIHSHVSALVSFILDKRSHWGD